MQDLAFPIDSVICSGYDAITTIVDYLHSIGHRKICYLGETKCEQRYTSYVDSLKRLDLPFDKSSVIDVLFTPSDSYSGLKHALNNGLDCTVIICANNASAAGVIKALREARKSIPRDISIVGINDVESTCYLETMLTTISIPYDEMGKHVVRLLLDRINHGHYAPVKLYIPSRLVVRDSCIPVDCGWPAGSDGVDKANVIFFLLDFSKTNSVIYYTKC